MSVVNKTKNFLFLYGKYNVPSGCGGSLGSIYMGMSGDKHKFFIAQPYWESENNTLLFSSEEIGDIKPIEKPSDKFILRN